MTGTVDVRCRCGEVVGRLANASPGSVSRIICYCDDCQAYLHQLGRSELLDDQGGTDIVQVAPACLSFLQGTERIAGLRLSPKGLYRWYSTCCKTPLGNTVSPAIPFVGMTVQTFATSPRTPDDVFGKPLGRIFGKYAIGTPPAGSTQLNLGLLLRAIRAVLGWRLTGKTWPHPFWSRDTRQPLYPVTTLSSAEREALRGLCGPRPRASTAA